MLVLAVVRMNSFEHSFERPGHDDYFNVVCYGGVVALLVGTAVFCLRFLFPTRLGSANSEKWATVPRASKALRTPRGITGAAIAVLGVGIVVFDAIQGGINILGIGLILVGSVVFCLGMRSLRS